MNYLDQAFGTGTTEEFRAAATIDDYTPSFTQAEASSRIYLMLVWPNANQSIILDLDAMHISFNTGLCDSAPVDEQSRVAGTLGAALLPVVVRLGFLTTSAYAAGSMAGFLEQEGLSKEVGEASLLTADLNSEALLSEWRSD